MDHVISGTVQLDHLEPKCSVFCVLAVHPHVQIARDERTWIR